ncbi:hypothetical protein NDK50_07890 [Paraburkholderia bryophila]|uniref:hypothetical protein n=1 Tax=Paraburkholderia bryophila TaxID=420952 RepID=UPI00234A03E5|nr:hypothetical protein [Paraburkholderia bryophila]WCM21357.1 hypothetical protein NDK50_07890 [Paraburkholderia bryophila]
MNGNVLREFLVALGFTVDEVGMKKFVTAVEGVTKSVKTVGLEVAAAATGIVAGVKIISSQMENLYYASQRTGATVGNIMALRYAAGQIGLTADQAQGALENFSRTLRLNPGSSNLLDSLGVTGKDPAERFDSFIAKAKQMQPYVAAAYAGLFGIDPDTLLMLEQGQDKRLAAEEAYKDKLARFGIDPEQAAKAGVDFNNSIRSVTDTFSDLWIVIESKLAPVLTPLVDQFEKFAENHAGEVAQGIADAVQNLANWIQSVDWKKVGDDIDSVYHAIGGMKGVLIALAAIQLAPLVGGILNLAAAVTRLGAAAAGGAIGGLLKVLGPIALMFHSEDLNKGEDDYLKQRQDAAGAIDPATFDFNGPANRGGKTPENPSPLQDASKAGSPDDGNQPFGTIIQLPAARNIPVQEASTSKVSRGIRNNNPGNIEYGAFTRSAGATGSDGRFAVFATMQEGMRATEKLLQSYVSRGYDTIRTMISRWAPGSENNTKAYIEDVAKRLGLSADSKISKNQIGDVAQAIFSHENGIAYANTSTMMASAKNTHLGVQPQGGRNVTLTQTNTFHIDGTSDPQGTARAIGYEQSRTNGDMVRNFAGAFK